MIFKQWQGPWPPKDSDHPFFVGERLIYCRYPFDWGSPKSVFEEVVVTGVWFDNDYPVVNIRCPRDGKRELGIMVDRFRLISVVEKLAELAD